MATMTENPPGPRPLPLAASVAALGVSAVLTQLVMMRELLGAFEGNELVLGAILGNWLLLMGAGAWLGRWSERLRRPAAVLAVLQGVLALVPLVMLLAVRGLRHVLFLRGSAAGLSEITVFAFALLLPYCLTAGFLLALACGLLGRSSGPAGPARAYTLDSLGALAGGALFSFVLVRHVDHLSALYLGAALNLAAATVLAWSARRVTLAAAITLATAVLAGGAALLDLDAWSIRLEHPQQRVLMSRQSPFGRVTVTTRGGQIDFFDAARTLFSLGERAQAEELVHPAMAQRPAGRRVLVIGGGAAGLLDELVKWPVAGIDYVEIDAALVQAAWQFGVAALEDPRVRLIFDDARRYLRETPTRYDVILLDVGEPSTFQANRFYTREFFALARRALGEQGVLAFRLGDYANCVPPELADMLAAAHRTLRESFAQVRLFAFPFSSVLFLASNAELTTDLAERIRRAGVRTRHLEPGILADAAAPLRQADLRRAVDRPAQVNRDFNPVLYRHQMRFWIREFPLSFGLLEGFLLVVLAAYLVRLRPVGLAVFTTGLASSSLQIVLLIGFQIVHGYVYEGLGAMVTLFMAGLVAGSWLGAQPQRLTASLQAPRSRRTLIVLTLLLAGLAGVLPWLLGAMARPDHVGAAFAGDLARPALLALSLATGLLTGWVFPAAVRAQYESPARTGSKVYTADFVGSCLGSLLTATLLIPLLGVFAACWITAGFCGAAAALLAWRRAG